MTSPPSRIIELASKQLPQPHAKDGCRKCGYPDGYLARYIHQNGTVAIRWVCIGCEDFKTAKDLPVSVLHATLIADGERVITIQAQKALRDQLPLRQDNSLEPRRLPACIVCGDDAPHDHHWAPVSIFPDWPINLVVPLCIPHHDEWHHTMRAHGLRYPHELASST